MGEGQLCCAMDDVELEVIEVLFNTCCVDKMPSEELLELVDNVATEPILFRYITDCSLDICIFYKGLHGSLTCVKKREHYTSTRNNDLS